MRREEIKELCGQWMRDMRAVPLGTRLRLLLFKNFRIRLVSVVVALGAWAYVQIRTDQVVVDLSVPIQFSLAENYTARAFTTNGQPIQAVSLSIICGRRDRDVLRDVDYAVLIDLTGESENILSSLELKEGEQVAYVGPGHQTGRYQLRRIEPQRIRVEIDRSVRKNLFVEPVISGSPAEGYEITKTNVNPTAVMVRGPSRVLQDVISIKTDPIAVDGLSKTFQGKMRLDLSTLAAAAVDQTTVDVTIGINLKPVQSRFSGIVISALNKPSRDVSITVAPPTATVTLQAHQEQMSGVTPDAIAAYIDARFLTSGSFTLPVRVVPPAGCTLVGAEPGTVTVTVKSFIGE